MTKNGRYPDYPLFKGLQRPLELMGLQGRYIYWAAGVAGGAIVGFIAAYCLMGFGPDWSYWQLSYLRESCLSSSNSERGCTVKM